MFNLKRCHQSMTLKNYPTMDKIPELCDLSWTYWDGNIQQITEFPPKTETTWNVENNLQLNNVHDTNQVPLTPFKRGPLIAHRFTKKFRALR